jgi:hypothetical protein
VTRNIKVIDSNKDGINNQESASVVCDGTIYLRIWTRSPKFELVTATASENNGYPTVCNEQTRLIATASSLCAKHGGNPEIRKDHAGRIFAVICIADSVIELGPVIEEFFDIYDQYKHPNPDSANEMRELYKTLSTSESDDAVYLSDGVWLRSDGTLDDEGR